MITNAQQAKQLAELAALEAHLESLVAEQREVRERVDRLRRGLATPGPTPIVVAPSAQVPGPAPATQDEKVTLFRDLFRGRDDVFPRAWSNQRKGTKGWAPACGHEWERGLCEKPRVKCSACPNQAYLPVTDKVLLDHLQGRHVVGVYPLLRDERCHLLAVDFDKDGWKEDAAEFVATCRATGVPVALERSRSGNGAHAWFFFEASVPAVLARRLGCYLITETMSRRPALSMASYDRLGMKARRAALEQLAAIPAKEERVVVATGRYIGEGFDDPRLDTLFLALPVAWKGTVAQYAALGRSRCRWLLSQGGWPLLALSPCRPFLRPPVRRDEPARRDSLSP